jgi:ribonuclease D
LKLDGDLAIDSEAMGLNMNRDRLCVIQLSNGDGNAYLISFDGSNYDAPNLKKLLLDPKRVKIFHYARFDVAIIYKYLGIKLENIYCTKIASKIARTYTEHHGLKDLCRELLDVNLSKQQQSSYWGAEELSKEQSNYAASDVLYLHKLKEMLDNMLSRESRLELAYRCFKFIPLRVELDVLGWLDIDVFAL